MREPLTPKEEKIVDLMTNLIWYGGFITLPALILTYLKRKRTR